MVFAANLKVLPAAQRALWPELHTTPDVFTLYGGTALALRLGHRTSLDFDFFSNSTFDPEHLADEIPYLKDSERVQVSQDTLVCRVHRGGPVLVSFFGALGLAQVAPREQVQDTPIFVASLLDIGATKAAVVQKRAEARDYLDIDALLQHGIDLATVLAAGAAVYGRRFNPLITLKALTYFEDVPMLPEQVRVRLGRAAKIVDVTKLPVLEPMAGQRGGDVIER